VEGQLHWSDGGGPAVSRFSVCGLRASNSPDLNHKGGLSTPIPLNRTSICVLPLESVVRSSEIQSNIPHTWVKVCFQVQADSRLKVNVPFRLLHWAQTLLVTPETVTRYCFAAPTGAFVQSQGPVDMRQPSV
jgi:hypothetical protein